MERDFFFLQTSYILGRSGPLFDYFMFCISSLVAQVKMKFPRWQIRPYKSSHRFNGGRLFKGEPGIRSCVACYKNVALLHSHIHLLLWCSRTKAWSGPLQMNSPQEPDHLLPIRPICLLWNHHRTCQLCSTLKENQGGTHSFLHQGPFMARQQGQCLGFLTVNKRVMPSTDNRLQVSTKLDPAYSQRHLESLPNAYSQRHLQYKKKKNVVFIIKIFIKNSRHEVKISFYICSILKTMTAINKCWVMLLLHILLSSQKKPKSWQIHQNEILDMGGGVRFSDVAWFYHFCCPFINQEDDISH